jgi:hypothetical protein
LQSPLTTVVIPTASRPAFLPLAVQSALEWAGPGVEVIVVPNGPDESWRSSLRQFSGDPRVLASPITHPNANAARNHGLALAHGEYVRFLDDDDYLLPGARNQLAKAIESGAEVTSGNVDLVGKDGAHLKTLPVQKCADFVESILSPGRRTGLQFHLYRRSAISPFHFDEATRVGQDTHWTHALCRSKDWIWARVEESVCVWLQHPGGQISGGLGVSGHLKLQEAMLWETILALKDQGRLSGTRAEAASRGMWWLIHSAFFLSPIHWSSVLKKHRMLFPDSLPDLAIYANEYGRRIDPLLLEALMVPKRWLNHACRQLLVLGGRKSQWQYSP